MVENYETKSFLTKNHEDYKAIKNERILIIRLTNHFSSFKINEFLLSIFFSYQTFWISCNYKR